jgi:hypothetical protein
MFVRIGKHLPPPVGRANDHRERPLLAAKLASLVGRREPPWVTSDGAGPPLAWAAITDPRRCSEVRRFESHRHALMIMRGRNEQVADLH